MLRWLSVVGVLLAVGCSAPGTAANGLPAGLSTRTAGRDYRVYVPAGVAPSAPLVVVLGSDDRWQRLADAQRFVVAYAEGGDAAAADAVVTDVSANVSVDPRRVFAVGGTPAYAAVCATGTFAAIAVVAAPPPASCPAPRPTSVLALAAGPNDAAAARATEYWRAVDRCGPPTVDAAPPLLSVTADCPDGRAVELLAVDGVGAGRPVPVGRLWRFFADHPRLD
ncbi:hypothetical protein LV457_06300 [Mycobacterium sp. MYCO198283]|uniref:hypothetical protein n=1 Tax=Mycobacterium sp. MYCO198283 TaxID=2883505 RepID=UPI001E28625E|nr:hypothetical protein [Mycobacterium sp. MYCO198283]MCG5431903.1 hypothetical protein [Mycobacterium sp. MYCO198283]